MKSWINKWFSFSWKKLVLGICLIPAMYFCEKIEFPLVRSYIRDALQFLNDPTEVDKSLVTVNINGEVDTFTRPFSFEVFRSVIDKLRSYDPEYIILCFSSKEIQGDQLKTNLIKYLSDKKNIFMQSDYLNTEIDIAKDPILNKYERILSFSSGMDVNQGARDRKPRRIVIHYDKDGPAKAYEVLKKLRINAKDVSYFKYSFRIWETDQIYMKNYPLGSFGSFNADDVLDDKVASDNFKGKIILLGSFDEFSYSGLPSVFNFFDRITGKNFKSYYFPHVDNLASFLNAFITGEYMKVSSYFNDLIVSFVLLTLLIFYNTSLKNKIFIFLLIIPTYLIFITISYTLTSFFFDFSRSIASIFFLQYLGIPIILFAIFKEQESKRLSEINEARIDALLNVSEKVAHDIRSPLSAINLVMAKAKFDDPEYQEILNSAVKRIDETATKILTRYRTKSGTEHEQTEAINFLEIIVEIVKEKRILNNKIVFEIINNSETSKAEGLRLDLERILSNVIDNSIFALKNIVYPKIIVKIEDSKNMVAISISDNGTGIPEQVLNLIGNQRFTTKVENNQGNGIGLLHAKRVIERLNGTFHITSRENIGTTIKISLLKA